MISKILPEECDSNDRDDLSDNMNSDGITFFKGGANHVCGGREKCVDAQNTPIGKMPFIFVRKQRTL